MTCLVREFLGQKMTVMVLMIVCRKNGNFSCALLIALSFRYLMIYQKKPNNTKKLCENSIGFYRNFIKFMINFNGKECYEIH